MRGVSHRGSGGSGAGRGRGQFSCLRTHNCIKCNFVCDKRATLKRHIRDIHFKRLECEVCDKTFGRSRRGRLINHMATKHGYPVPSSYNVNVPLRDVSFPSMCAVPPVSVPVSSYARFLPPTPSPPPLAIPSYFTSDLFPLDQTPCPSPSSGSWPVESEMLATPTLKLRGSSPVAALVSYPYSPGSPAVADPPPSLPVTLDWGTTASSPQPFYTAGATLVAEVTQAPDTNSTSSGPLSLFPNLDRFSDPANFLGSPSAGAAEETTLSTSAQLASLSGRLVIIPAPSEATGNLDPESRVETLDAPTSEMEVSPTSTSIAPVPVFPSSAASEVDAAIRSFFKCQLLSNATTQRQP